MFKKTLLCASTLAFTLAMTGCVVEDGNRYRSDVYSANAVNRVQAVETVEIVYISPAQVAVPTLTKNRKPHKSFREKEKGGARQARKTPPTMKRTALREVVSCDF